MDELGERAGLSPAVLDPVIKTVGIAILTRISSEVCRDAGESGIAAAVETAGAVLALWIAAAPSAGGAGYGDEPAVSVRKGKYI